MKSEDLLPFDSFLAIAEQLKLKGFTGAIDDNTKMSQVQHILKNMNGLENTIDPILDLLKGETSWPIQEFLFEKKVSVLGHIQQLDENITSIMTKDKSIIFNGHNQVRLTRCSMCVNRHEIHHK